MKLINISKEYTNNIYFLGLLEVNLKSRSEYSRVNMNVIDSLLEKICLSNNVTYIRMRDILAENDLVDGLHPNEIGHEKISNYIYNLFKNRV